jgi:phenylacetic acid degradation operon negative regulatory protein
LSLSCTSGDGDATAAIALDSISVRLEGLTGFGTEPKRMNVKCLAVSSNIGTPFESFGRDRRSRECLMQRADILTSVSDIDEASADATTGAEPSAMPRHQQLTVTIYGLYAREAHDALAVADLIRFMGDLGVEAAGVRSSVSRLKRRGILKSRREGRVATYAISDKGLQMFNEGDTRIFAPPRATVADAWLLAVFSIPETLRAQRHVLRSELTRLGFGSVASGVWIAPVRLWEQTRPQLERLDLGKYVSFFSANYLLDGIREKVADWWDLGTLDTMYSEFITRYDGLLREWERRLVHPEPADLRDAFIAHVPMFTEWRRLPYLDPGLPLEYLPADWNGLRAEELFGNLHRLLGPLAREYVQATILR